MASLKKIAAELGVSYTLVSKVLNGRMGTTGVSPKTREAILAKAKELEYRPNPLAVALKGGRSGAVAVFIHEMGTPGSDLLNDVLRSVAEGLNRTHTRMWLRLFSSDVEFEEACDEKMLRTVDGMIVAGVAHPKLFGRFAELEKLGLPIVVISGTGQTLEKMKGYVKIDAESQGYLPTEHLLQRGCRKLVSIDAAQALRHNGFIKAHKDKGLSVDPKRSIAAKDFTILSGREAVDRLVAGKISFDGIVAQSDAQALGAIQRLAELGIKVPQEVKVTGVDDSPLAQASMVPITSMTSGMAEAGKLAVDLLWRKLEGREVRIERVHPQLITRASSGI